VDVADYGIRDRADNGFRYRAGPSMRHIVELNPAGIRSFNAIPGGQSSIPGNKHYADLLPLWLANAYFPVYYAKSEIDANAESTQDFVPEK
jgi:penicillin amidase